MSRRRRPHSAVVTVARWSAEHPWRAMLSWVVFVALCVVIGGMVGTRTQSDVDQAVGEWGRSERIIEQGHFADPAVESVLVTARSGVLDQARARAALAEVAQRFASLAEVRDTKPPIMSKNGSAMLLQATMTVPDSDASGRVQPMLDATGTVQARYPDLRVEEVGGASIGREMDDTISADFGRAEKLSIPITLVILVVAFGALLAAGVPVLLALSSVGAAIGLSALVSQLMPVQELLSSVILLIGMAVGVDYSLFYVRRAREERARGATSLDAVEIAAATSGRAVVVSGCTVAIAMAGMFLSGNAIFVSFAVGTILVVAVAMIGSITVLPAVLAKLGRWVDRPRVPLLHRLTMRSSETSRLWSVLLRPALRRPALALVISAGLLTALALPAVGLRTKDTSSKDLPRSIPTVAAYDRLIEAFPNEGDQHIVAVRGPADAAPAIRTALLDLARRTQGNPLYAAKAEPELKVSADRRIAVLSIPIPYDSGAAEAEKSLRDLRTSLAPSTVGRVPGAEWAVGGGTASSVDFRDVLNSRLPWIIGFVLTLTFLVMVSTFRSVVIAGTAIVLNLLSVGAAYGLLVLVFQHHWAEGLLNFHSNGGIVSWLPMFLFVILFGLSMDYHVFVVSRIREAALRGMPTRQAVERGVTSSAGAVTSAAVVMVAVFGIFATLTLLDFKQMGIGLAAAILIDATVVRVVLLPATMTLLGRWNWWAPQFLNRRLPWRPVDEAGAGAWPAPVPVPEAVGASR